MKYLENKKTEVPGSESYAVLLKQVANFIPPHTGLSPSEMRERIKLMDIAEKGGENMEFEDATADSFKTIAEQVKWAIVHKDIVRFLDDVQAL